MVMRAPPALASICAPAAVASTAPSGMLHASPEVVLHARLPWFLFRLPGLFDLRRQGNFSCRIGHVSVRFRRFGVLGLVRRSNHAFGFRVGFLFLELMLFFIFEDGLSRFG